MLDLGGYRDCLHRCRERFRGLGILSGVELSEPHWHASRATSLLRDGGFDRVLAAVHSGPVGAGLTEVSGLFRDQAPAQVARYYLTETAEL
jgi:histidinol-phosphatase (PHP family)